LLYTPDVGSGTLSLVGGPTLNYASGTYFAQGSEGSGTYAINSKGWDNGTNTKCWLVKISTVNLIDIKVSSKQKGSNKGPKEFKLQWSVDSTNWYDVTGATITVANDNFSSGVLNNIALPSQCNNQSFLYIRWVVSSTASIDGGTVASGGTNRIDNILITGTTPTNNYTVTFGVEGQNGTLRAFDQNNTEISSGATLPQGSNINFVAKPDKGYKVNQWKLNDTVVPGEDSTIYTYENLQSNIDVKVSFTEAISAQLDRNKDTVDFLHLQNLVYTITWNDATRIDSIISNKGTVEEYVLEPGVDYTVAGNTLTLILENKKSEFQILYIVPVTVIFDIGNDQVITLYEGAMAYNVNYSVAQGLGTLDGFIYDENWNVVPFNSGELVNSYKGAYFDATPEQGYVVERWRVNGEDVVDSLNELYTDTIFDIAGFEQDVVVQVYFKQATVLNNLKANIVLSPNPTKDILKISAEKSYNVVITDIRGLKVLEYKMLQKNASVDLSKLSNGVYFVSLQNDNEKLVYKIVKQ